MSSGEKSNLTDLIEQAVTRSAFSRIAKMSESIGEELANEMLRDPEFRDQMKTLVKAAFEKALTDLAKSAPEPSGRRYPFFP